MTVEITSRPPTVHSDLLSEFCRRVLARIPRADQRRWGEIYIRGLISLNGRKSLHQIASRIAGEGADQALQQFVNQSPWDWRPVRADLAQYAEARLRPRAWVLSDFALPKNGRSSVGVERQYAHSLGRVINCQAGVSLFLAGPEAAVPVDWRLRLPPSWDGDADRRERAHLPVHERSRARWEYAVSLIDEVLSWDVTPAPVIVDCAHDPQVDPLIMALERRKLRYLVRVGAGALVGLGRGVNEPAYAGGTAAAVPVSHLTTPVPRQNGARMSSASSRFALRALPPLRLPHDPRPRPRHLLMESGPGLRPDGLWLTNLVGHTMPQLVGLTSAVARISGDMDRLRDRFGLGHFEGRSFRGWHHHATLVSLAHAFMAGREGEVQGAA